MHTLNATYVIWKRELLGWWRNPTRIIGSLAIPVIFLFVLGSGLSGAMGPLTGAAGGGGVDFQQFIFPGVVAMSVFFAALFNSISLVFDREFGILKEVLVSPVNRAAIALGKTLGGATVATLQGTLVFVFAPVVGVRLTPLLVLKLWPVMFLGAFALASMGTALAARMGSTQNFQVVNQFVVMPLMFLSGIMFPLRDLPAWMNVLVKVNPVSYAVDPLRRLVLEAQGLPSAVMDRLSRFGLGMAIGGHQVSVTESLAIIAVFAVVVNGLATWLVSIRD